ncbi:hypothetical protein CONPUDRAFT_149654 [Coniophora puteana RWD-64-598 SS2]|uniref:Uncharacterized protein n=1 Tax=Coniophora puteana (strain RWD-64-598) TaxID=741705 RepID=A0A5M3N1K6_CONPW|nr:uncharacterized protein CONPUDRAFT_149654 [Coniophora puteana RWD-64-598 SS2]EIW84785.1 hypothetical protein CONPUDRAFT_149654 [Coniophora puteana RWD-64-598 SS2]
MDQESCSLEHIAKITSDDKPDVGIISRPKRGGHSTGSAGEAQRCCDSLFILFKTNHYAVSPEESAAIADLLSDTHILTRDFDNAILTLRSLKRQVISFSTACKVFTSSVGRLPTEILAENFILARPRYVSEVEGLSSTSTRPHAGLLTSFNAAQVCRRWRQVALGTPWLWNTMHVYGVTDLDQDALHMPLEMLSMTKSVPSYLSVGLLSAHDVFIQMCRKGSLSVFEQKCRGLEVYAAFDRKHTRYLFYDYSKVRELLGRFKRVERLALLKLRLDDFSASASHWHKLAHLHLRVAETSQAHGPVKLPVCPHHTVLALMLNSHITLDLASSSAYPQLTDLSFIGLISRNPLPFCHNGLKRVGVQDTGEERFLDMATLPSLEELSTSIQEYSELQLGELVLRS